MAATSSVKGHVMSRGDGCTVSILRLIAGPHDTSRFCDPCVPFQCWDVCARMRLVVVGVCSGTWRRRSCCVSQMRTCAMTPGTLRRRRCRLARACLVDRKDWCCCVFACLLLHSTCWQSSFGDSTTLLLQCTCSSHLLLPRKSVPLEVLCRKFNVRVPLPCQMLLLLRAVDGVVKEHAATEAEPAPASVSPSPSTMPIVLCGDFNSLAVKTVPDGYDVVSSFPPGGIQSGAYQLVTTGVRTARAEACASVSQAYSRFAAIFLLWLESRSGTFEGFHDSPLTLRYTPVDRLVARRPQRAPCPQRHRQGHASPALSAPAADQRVRACQRCRAGAHNQSAGLSRHHRLHFREV